MPQRAFRNCFHRRLSLLAASTALAGALLLSPTALAQEDGSAPKWSGWLELGGKIGTERSLGQFDIYAPAWQDERSLALVNLRMVGDNHSSMEGNLGVIYRRMLESGWNLGGYGYLDVRRSEHDNTFHQATLGVEALGPDFDVRANAYIPFGAQWQDAPSESELDVQSGELQLRAGEERALYGADAEVGARVPVFEREGPLDLRVYAGGYHFDGADAESVTGPRGRVELDIFELPGLSPNARVTASAEAQWDEPRGSQGFLGLSLSIPLQGDLGGSDARPLTRQERRMMAPVVRDVDIVTEAGPSQRPETTEDVENAATGVTIGEVVEVAGGGDNLAEALAEAEENGLVVAKGGEGDLDGGVTLEDGQTLVGGGHDLVVRGVDSGTTMTYSAPGSRGTVWEDSDAVVTLADNTYVGGLEVRGGGRSAASDNMGVYGGAIIDSGDEAYTTITNVTLAGNDIAETGGDGIAFGDFTTAVTLNDNEVSRTDGAGIDFGIGAGDGIFGDGVFLSNNEISATSDDGISFGDGAGADGGRVTLSGNKIGGTENESSVEGHGVAFDDFAGSYEGRVTLSNNEISETNGDGVRFGDGAGGESGRVMVSDNAITRTGKAGISFGEGAGAVDGLAILSGNEINDTGNEPAAVGHGVSFDDFAGIDEGHVWLNGNEISGTGGDGVSFGDDAGDEGGRVTLTGNSISNTGENLDISSDDTSEISETGDSSFPALVGRGIHFTGSSDGVIISGNRITDTELDGILFSEPGSGLTASNITINKNKIIDTGGGAIYFFDTSSDLEIEENIIQDTAGPGIHISVDTQDVVISDNRIVGTEGNGIELLQNSKGAEITNNRILNTEAEGISIGNGSSSPELSNNRIEVTDGHGITIGEDNAGAQLSNNAVSHTGGDGIRFGDDTYGAVLRHNEVSETEGDGISFGRNATIIPMADNSVSGTEGSGIAFGSAANDVEMVGNEVSDTANGGAPAAGINFADGAQNINMLDNSVSDSAQQGISFGGNTENLELSGNILSDANGTAVEISGEATDAEIADNRFEGEVGGDLFRLEGGTYSGKDNLDVTDRLGGKVCDSTGDYSSSDGFEIDTGTPLVEVCGADD